MKYFLFLALVFFSLTTLGQSPYVFDKNCESYAREQKFLRANSSMLLKESDKRIFLYEQLTPAYASIVNEVNQHAPQYYSDPKRRNIIDCNGTPNNKCISYRAYCTETIAKSAIRDDLEKWRANAKLCTPQYAAKHPKACSQDALNQINYVYDQALHLAKAEKNKNADAQKFFADASREFAKYRDDMKALIAEQKKLKQQHDKKLEEEKNIKLMAQAMQNCQQVINDDDDDVQNRALASKITDELGCEEQLASLNQPQLNQLKKDIDAIMAHIDVHPVLDEVNSIALEKSATALWASQRQLSGHKLADSKSALALACKESPYLCKNGESKKVLEQTFKKHKDELAQVEVLSPEDVNRTLQRDFNPAVEELNKYCAQASAEWRKISREISDQEAKKFEEEKKFEKERMNVIVRDNLVVKNQNHFDERYFRSNVLLKATHGTFQTKFSELLNSKLGHLMMTKELQEKVGIVNEKTIRSHCLGGDGKILKPATSQDINVAKGSFNKLLSDELNKLTTGFRSGTPRQREAALKDYLKSNPGTIAELLKKNPDPQYAKLMCHLIREINTSDHMKEIGKNVVMGVGVVASVALAATGVGSPLGVALFATVTGMTVASAGASLDDYFTHQKEARYSRQSGATGQMKQESAIAEGQKSDKKAEESFEEFATTIALEAAGFGVGKIIKGVSGMRKVANIADDVVETGSDLKQTNKIVKEVKDDVKPNVSARAEDAHLNLNTNSYSTPATPLSQADYDDAYKAFRTYDDKNPYMLHIRGDFDYVINPEIVSQTKLSGGMHTMEGVDFLKKMRPDIADQISLKELPSGVIVADVPEAAFYAYKFKRLSKGNLVTKTIDGVEVKFNQKTLFPKAWTDDDVIRAIEDVKANRANFVEVKKDIEVFRGEYQGVKIEMIIKDGKVETAYPLPE